MKLLHGEITGTIIDAFYEVYGELGYGFLEKVYENAMMFELEDSGLVCINQKPIKVFYKNKLVGDFNADISADDKVIVELKSLERITPKHETQLVNYLKATRTEVGLLMNFGPKPEYKRRVLTKEYLQGLKQK
ncbi:MAG: GxxExxY protein [Bacteroidales bacterium]|nr:GxxExxY protein [Bacteroidales bacterium]MCF8457872.1 GxxExxY protein [Bacteroidales bacterium]